MEISWSPRIQGFFSPETETAIDKIRINPLLVACSNYNSMRVLGNPPEIIQDYVDSRPQAGEISMVNTVYSMYRIRQLSIHRLPKSYTP